MRGITLALAVCIVGISALVVSSAAQNATGAVTGIVTGVSGAAMSGVPVRLGIATGRTRTSITDARGEFRFENIPPGKYELTVAQEGFATETKAVTVRERETIRLSIVLKPDPQAKVFAPQAGVPGGVVGGVVGGLPSAPAPSAGPARVGRAGLRGPVPHAAAGFNTEAYDRIVDNDFHLVQHEPLSTFSIDVDTASYSNVRRFLNGGRLPPPDAVRTEELINYFRFDYPAPKDVSPFSITTELAACPWNSRHRLALVGLRARPMPGDSTPARNLVFLLDVSGSMAPPDKLPLVRTAMRMLVDTLTDRDRIAIVVYAGASGLVLPPTSGASKAAIHEAIARLEAGGSTNGGAGIMLAYRIAQEQFVKGGINRVILATDGDFNVGITNQGELTRLIEEKRATGVFLSVLGVGTGNLKDSTMEKLADKGNGNYAYLDSLHEARRVLIAEAGATFVTVAKDVKVQIEFNPSSVAAYRLIGYENRLLSKEDFNDDRKDAGEIGAGHTVTALYEIVPPGVQIDLPPVDPLKYQRAAAPVGASPDELMTVKLRYKQPDSDVSQLKTVAVRNRPGDLSPNIGFAAAVAEFGMMLRRSDYRGTASFEEAAALAGRFRGTDGDGYRAEFIRLVELAGALARQTRRE